MRWPDAGLRARAAELRAEWRAEEEEWSRAALESFEHSRILVDVLRALMHRGDGVLLGTGADALHGVVVHVGDDWCLLDTPGGAVDVPVGPVTPVVRVVERSHRGGTNGIRTAPAGWRARLFEHEMGRCACVVATHAGARFAGRLRVGGDHVIVGDAPGGGAVPGGEVFVPFGALQWVRRAEPGDLR